MCFFGSAAASFVVFRLIFCRNKRRRSVAGVPRFPSFEWWKDTPYCIRLRVFFQLWEEKHASMHSKNVTEAALLFVLLLRDAMEIVDSMDNPLVKEANRQQFRIFGSAHLTNDPGGPWITSTSSKMTSADIEFPLRQFSLKEKRIPQRLL